jgi:hypothetical protein
MLKESSMSDRFDVKNMEAHERNAIYVPELANVFRILPVITSSLPGVFLFI